MSIRQRPPGWTDNTWSAWCAILNLNPYELMMLKARIRDVFGPDDEPDVEGGAGVREPRWPKPEGPMTFGAEEELPTWNA